MGLETTMEPNSRSNKKASSPVSQRPGMTWLEVLPVAPQRHSLCSENDKHLLEVSGVTSGKSSPGLGASPRADLNDTSPSDQPSGSRMKRVRFSEPDIRTGGTGFARNLKNGLAPSSPRSQRLAAPCSTEFKLVMEDINYISEKEDGKM